ncbi:MAG: hypothetical protein PHF67_04895 [Candidatus Nanoarchaeia archaeon]|nr:hypothetical protein [Candidatus Nanoarchaeia archaeon]
MMNNQNKEPAVYIGYTEVKINGEIFMSIAISPDTSKFTGEFHPITADSGEGSFADLLFKLKRGIEELKGGNAENEKGM